MRGNQEICTKGNQETYIKFIDCHKTDHTRCRPKVSLLQITDENKDIHGIKERRNTQSM